MNRNLLLIAIAAIAVVAVAAGVLLLGSGQPSAPLSGRFDQAPTVLTLNISGCSVPDGNGQITYSLSGMLKDSNGSPLGNRTITLLRKSLSNGLAAVGPDPVTPVTRPDGTYSLMKREGPTSDYSTGGYVEYTASFAGDTLYNASSSSTVRKLC